MTLMQIPATFCFAVSRLVGVIPRAQENNNTDNIKKIRRDFFILKINGGVKIFYKQLRFRIQE